VRVEINSVIAIGTLCLIVVMVSAIVYQEFSWWVFLFGLLFGTIFTGILSLCILNYREDGFRRSSMDDYPNEPWMWDARWRSGFMASRNKSEFWGTLAFTIILGVFAFLGFVILFQELPNGNLWVLLSLIPIIAAIMFGRKLNIAWKALRFEEQVSLTSEIHPAWVGAMFSAVMKIEIEHQPQHVEVWLEHFKILRREEVDGVAFEKVVDCRLSGQAEYIGDGKTRVSAHIPENCFATSWSKVEQRRWWDLLIIINISGNAVSLRYEIPVADPAKHQSSVTDSSNT